MIAQTEILHKRKAMVENQLIKRGIRDEAVLNAVRQVPRNLFVPRALVEFAYEDSPLPIEEEQTISQPFIVAFMAEMMELEPGNKVLEVGTGSGYAAAVLGEIVDKVDTIERHETLAVGAHQRLQEQGYDNVYVRHGDGTHGWPEAAPFDAIVVAAGGPDIPEPLREQLAVNGRLLIPVGSSPRNQDLIRLRRISKDEYRKENLGAVRFVPLIGAAGWDEEESGSRRPRKLRRR